MTSSLLRLGASVGMAVALSAACASRASPRGRLDVHAVARDSLEVYIGKIRKLSAAAAPKRVPVPTVEKENSELQSALQALDFGATPSRHRRVADAYRQVGILDLAYDHYLGARHLDSRDAAAYDGLARIWRDWGLPDLGLGDATRALYYAPTSAAAHNTFGTLLYALGKTGDARRAFERALALDPDAAYVWTNLCYLSFQAGDFSAAVGRCRRALVLEAGLAPAHHNLGLVYAAAGDMTLAEAEFRAASGDAASREYNIGIAWSAARKYPEAALAFEAAETLRPGFTRATERARQARRLAQQPAALGARP
jgi:tetratricopeptide (TPR) repeat protein